MFSISFKYQNSKTLLLRGECQGVLLMALSGSNVVVAKITVQDVLGSFIFRVNFSSMNNDSGFYFFCFVSFRSSVHYHLCMRHLLFLVGQLFFRSLIWALHIYFFFYYWLFALLPSRHCRVIHYSTLYLSFLRQLGFPLKSEMQCFYETLQLISLSYKRVMLSFQLGLFQILFY